MTSLSLSPLSLSAPAGTFEPVLAGLTRRVDRVRSRISIAHEEKARLSSEVGLAKGRLEYQDEVTVFMEKVQQQLHEKTVGRYEQLLTAILRDVFPEEQDRIVIEITTKRGLTAINFSIETTTGDKEDVMDGRGGSIANVLSIGLRFISLSQTKLRQFMVLDEADCWLSPARIPAVGRVIHMLAEQIGVQTLLISHHDPKAFEAHALMVSLLKQGDTVVAEPNTTPQWQDDDNGIRGIYLHNVMSHENTFIPLSQGVTALIGDNDIGKSVVVTALRALLYGEGSESLIRHGSDRAMVTLDLGREGHLSYERFRKGAKKTRYALTVKGSESPEHESLEAGVPEWVKELGFGYEEDLDIQIGHQKRPVFLLDEPDTKRASILSVGKEASWMTAMRKQYKDDVKQDKDLIKQGEHRIQQLSPKLKLSDRTELAEDQMEDLLATHQDMMAHRGRVEKQREMVISVEVYHDLAILPAVNVMAAPELEDLALLPKYIHWTTHGVHLKALSQVKVPVSLECEDTKTLSSLITKYDLTDFAELSRVTLPNTVESEDTKTLLVLIEKIAIANRSLPVVPDLVVEPELLETQGITHMGRKMMGIRRTLNACLALSQSLARPQEPEILDTKQLQEMGEALTRLAHEKKVLTREIKADEEMLAKIEQEQDSLIEANGGSCPLCEQQWNREHTHG